MLNSQIQIHRILGFGATTPRDKRSQEGDKPAKETRKNTSTRRGSRPNTTAHQSHLIPIQIFFGTENSYTITSSLLRTRRTVLDPHVSTHHEVLNRCSSAAAFYVLQVAACNAERGCGAAAAVLKVIVSSSLDFFDGNFVFILTSVIITQSLCN